MNIPINISTTLRSFVDNQETVAVSAETPKEALAELARCYPLLAAKILTPDGRPRSFLRIFLNKKDIRHLDIQSISLRAGDSISLVPAISGG
jgi:molybdopterin converting factor small subunit